MSERSELIRDTEPRSPRSGELLTGAHVMTRPWIGRQSYEERP